MDGLKHDIGCVNELPEEKRGQHTSLLVRRRGVPMVGHISTNGISMHDDVVSLKMVSGAVGYGSDTF